MLLLSLTYPAFYMAAYASSAYADEQRSVRRKQPKATTIVMAESERIAPKGIKIIRVIWMKVFSA